MEGSAPSILALCDPAAPSRVAFVRKEAPYRVRFCLWISIFRIFLLEFFRAQTFDHTSPTINIDGLSYAFDNRNAIKEDSRPKTSLAISKLF